MRDNNALISLRPEISGLSSEHFTPAEQFQNNILRPILKFQHELLVQIVSTLPHMEALRLQSKSVEIFKVKVIDFLKQQSDVKNQIIGLIIGHFTLEEWSIYREIKTELNKRIIHMSGERVAGAMWI